jgi:hypothetical protein
MQNDLVADMISWRSATLIGAGQWQLGAWVRGLGGAYKAPALPIGTPFVLLNDALIEVPLDPSLVGIALNWQARSLADANLKSIQSANFTARAKQPWPPCNLRAKRSTTGVVISWTRRARGDGDAWASATAPLGAASERYVVSIQNAVGAILRSITTTTPTYTYSNTQELADFGAVQSQLRLLVRQIGDDDAQGVPLNEIVSL